VRLAPSFVLLALTAGVPRLASGGAPQVIQDDWARALAEAQAKDLPLFVDAWAPW
jgi:hypothetical protein